MACLFLFHLDLRCLVMLVISYLLIQLVISNAVICSVDIVQVPYSLITMRKHQPYGASSPRDGADVSV